MDLAAFAVLIFGGFKIEVLPPIPICIRSTERKNNRFQDWIIADEPVDLGQVVINDAHIFQFGKFLTPFATPICEAFTVAEGQSSIVGQSSRFRDIVPVIFIGAYQGRHRDANKRAEQ